MEEYDIKTKMDLYKRIRPVMYVKLKEIKKNYNVSILYEELFSFLEYKIWNQRTNLTMIQIVDDILNLNLDDLLKHVEKRRKNEK